MITRSFHDFSNLQIRHDYEKPSFVVKKSEYNQLRQSNGYSSHLKLNHFACS